MNRTIYLFDEFELDLGHATLSRNGKKLRIEPQVFLVLATLVENHEETVSRDELIEKVWQGRNVSNGVIDSRIHSARQALGDDGRTQKYIKTFTHLGFRFLGDVTEEPSEGSDPVPAPPVVPDSAPEASGLEEEVPDKPRANSGRSLKLVYGALAVGVAGLLGAAGYQALPMFMADGLDSDSILARPSIAVLAPSCAGDAVDAETPATVVASETIALLTTVRDLNVISRSSLTSFDGRDLSPDEIDDALQIDYRVQSLCEGSDGLAVELIRASDEQIIWSSRYALSGGEETAFDMQLEAAQDIVQHISNSLGVSLSDAAPRALSQESYEIFTLALANLDTQEGEQIGEAIGQLKEVISTNPDYLPAYAKLVDAYWAGMKFGGVVLGEAMADMQQTVRQMKVIAPNTPETLTAEALSMTLQNDFESFEVSDVIEILDRARDAGPNYAPASFYTAEILLLHERFVDAEPALEHALRLDPTSAELLAGAAWTQFNLGRTDEALRLARRNLRWNEDSNIAKNGLGRILVQGKDLADAYQVLASVLADNPEQYSSRFNMNQLFRELGDFEKAVEYAPDAARRAMTQAIAGLPDEARQSALELPNFEASMYALYILGDRTPMYNQLKSRYTMSQRDLSQQANSPPALYSSVLDAEILYRSGDNHADRRMADAGVYLNAYSPENFDSWQQFAGAVGYHALRGNKDRAFEILELANREGFVFLGTLNLPIYDKLRSDPRYQAHRASMERNAARQLTRIAAFESVGEAN